MRTSNKVTLAGSVYAEPKARQNQHQNEKREGLRPKQSGMLAESEHAETKIRAENNGPIYQTDDRWYLNSDRIEGRAAL